MLFEQDDKLCKQDIMSFEQHIKSSEQVKKKLACPFPGSVNISNCFIQFFTYSDLIMCSNSNLYIYIQNISVKSKIIVQRVVTVCPYTSFE